MDIRKRLFKSKKAILFSLISVLFAVLFITMFSEKFTTTYEDRIPGSNIRIKVMDVYARNFEVYIDDSIKVSTYNTLNGMSRYCRTNNKFFANIQEFNRTFYNCMTCGYVNCSNKIAVNICNNGQNYLNSRLDNITKLSMQQLNIRTNYTINSINVSQNYPFEVEVRVNITYNVTDNSSGNYYAKWTKTLVITAIVPITGLLEPTGYISDTTGTYKKTISRYTGPCEFDESCWDYTTTTQFYQGDNFRYYKDAPSFLQRYWNDNSSSDCCGIETMLHPSQLSPINRTRSFIEHYYWSGTRNCKSVRVVNLTLSGDQISLDEITASRYGVVNQSTLYCAP